MRSVSRLSPAYTLLILYFSCDVKQLYDLGRQYPWKKPDHCPCCRNNRLWGHGFVLRYLEPFAKAFWIRRYRCPDCGAVHTMRPDSYLEGLRYPLTVILWSLFIRACSDRWAHGLAYQIQQAWWRALLLSASVTANCPPARLKTLIIALCTWLFFRKVLLL